ncbi:MAG: hypothetical protein WBA45_06035 [Microthrixaceae bacterium]
MFRRGAVVLTVAVLMASAVACAPPTPGTARAISPNDGTGYVQPQISGDGNTVVYRREADQNAAFDTPRDLVVTRVDTQSTAVFPSVRDVYAVSHDGRFVVYGYTTTVRLDTVTGDEEILRTADGDSLSDVAISADGSSVGWVATHYSPGGNCPCERRIHVWRDGTETLDVLMEGPIYIGIGDQFRDSLWMKADGSAVFAHRFATRDVVRFDSDTGASSVVPLQFPTIGDISPFPSLQSYLFWSEWLQFSSSDGSHFLLKAGDTMFMLSSGAPQVIDPVPGSTGTWAMSSNARFRAGIVSTPVRPGVDDLAYVVTDLSSGESRNVIESESSDPGGTGPAKTFNGAPSVADNGRVTYGLWAPLPTGPWPPSVIYVDR